MERKRKKRVFWTTDMEMFLLCVWKEYAEALRKSRKHSQVYVLMEKAFKDSEFNNVSAEEIRTKICNFSKRYRLETRKFQSTGERSQWQFYSEINNIINSLTTTNDTEWKKVHMYDSSLDASQVSYASSEATDISTHDFQEVGIKREPSPFAVFDDPLCEEDNKRLIEEPPSLGFVDESEVAPPPSKKKKIEIKTTSTTDTLLKEIIKIEEKRTEMMKELAEKRIQVFKEMEEKKLKEMKARNEILNKILEKL